MDLVTYVAAKNYTDKKFEEVEGINEREYVVHVPATQEEPFLLANFPTFYEGDIVEITVDGIGYALPAYFDENAGVLLGDTLYNWETGTGIYKWTLTSDPYDGVLGLSQEPHIISWKVREFKQINVERLPKALQIGEVADALVAYDGEMQTYTMDNMYDGVQIDFSYFRQFYYDKQLEVGYFNPVTIEFDGVPYEMPWNDGIFGSGERFFGDLDNGDPFYARMYGTGSVVCTINIATAEPGIHHVKAYVKMFKNKRRLDEEYMPLLTSPNGTQYKLTVADNGTLSAVPI